MRQGYDTKFSLLHIPSFYAKSYKKIFYIDSEFLQEYNIKRFI